MKEDFKSPPLKWFRFDSVLGWDRQPGYSGTLFDIYRAWGSDGYDVEDMAAIAQNPGWPRVVTVGDSRTFGYGVSRSENWSEGLRARLPQTNIVNLGVHGYSSYQGLRSLESRVWNLKPSVLTVAFGYNDRRSLLPTDLADGPQRFESIYSTARTRSFLTHVYIARALGKLMDLPIHIEVGREHIPDQPGAMALPPTDVRSLHVRVPVEAYRANMTALVEAAKQQNVPVVLLLLRDNPHETSRIASELRRLAAAGQWDEADRLLAKHDEVLHPDFVIARAELARLYTAAGRPADADRVAFSSRFIPSLHGGPLLVEEDPYVAALLDVAAQTNTPLVDFGATLLERPELFTDDCHFNAQGNALLADALVPKLQRLLAERSQKP